MSVHASVSYRIDIYAFVSSWTLRNKSNNSLFSHEPTRTRKLLLHKKQILAFRQNVEREGYTLVPVRVYIKKGICKVQIALAKGKKNYDKREVIKEREDKIHASRRRKAINQR